MSQLSSMAIQFLDCLNSHWGQYGTTELPNIMSRKVWTNGPKNLTYWSSSSSLRHVYCACWYCNDNIFYICILCIPGENENVHLLEYIRGAFIKMGSPLQKVLGLLPLGDLSSTVIVVLLSRGADVFCPVICWVLLRHRCSREKREQLNLKGPPIFSR